MNNLSFNRKTILLTFDYELFFKKSGTAENCLLKPVNLLIEVFDKYNIKSTFFVDVLYYMRLLELSETRNQSKLIKNQLQCLVGKGHRIELHLHPHWLDAEYCQGEWLFKNYRNYRLQNLSQEQVTELFVSGTQILNELASEVKPDYKVIAFRAGGWCVQPFEKIKAGFEKSGIYVDSSVASGIKGNSEAHSFDFSMISDQKAYNFSKSLELKEENGGLREIPISTYNENYNDKFKKVYYKLFNKTQFRSFGDGVPIGFTSPLDKLKCQRKMMTLDGYGSVNILEHIRLHPFSTVNIISHPKAITQYSYEVIKKMHERKYSFMTLKEHLSQDSALK